MKIWTYEEMMMAIQTMTEEEKHKLLTLLLQNEAVMIMVKRDPK